MENGYLPSLCWSLSGLLDLDDTVVSSLKSKQVPILFLQDFFSMFLKH